MKTPFAAAAYAAAGLLLLVSVGGCVDSDPNPKIELATPENTQGHMPAQMVGAGGPPPKPATGAASGASSK